MKDNKEIAELIYRTLMSQDFEEWYDNEWEDWVVGELPFCDENKETMIAQIAEIFKL